MAEYKVTRYANRKLYSKREGYLSLGKLRGILAAGESLRVVCSATGKDLTPSILARMIAQDASGDRVEAAALLACIASYGGLAR